MQYTILLFLILGTIIELLAVNIYLAYKLNLTSFYFCWKCFYHKNIRIRITIQPTVSKYLHVQLRRMNSDVPKLIKYMTMS